MEYSFAGENLFEHVSHEVPMKFIRNSFFSLVF